MKNFDKKSLIFIIAVVAVSLFVIQSDPTARFFGTTASSGYQTSSGSGEGPGGQIDIDSLRGGELERLGDRTCGPDEMRDDWDGDGLVTCYDNCPTVSNANQDDIDSDGIGDACDDSDGDGLTDKEELDYAASPNHFANCLDWTNPDSDGEGLSDGIEMKQNKNFGTGPLLGGGGVHSYILLTYSDPCKVDTDIDGLSDFDEYKLETNPQNVDSDNDWIWDGSYTNLGAFIGMGPGEQASGTNPLIWDTDGDGLEDGYEVFYVLVFNAPSTLDPLNPDQDGNGIIDGLDDWDGDGLNGIDDSGKYCNVYDTDTDGDGLDDDFEVINNIGNCRNIDTDLDGLTDYDEVCYYENLNNLNCDLTNPNVYDPFSYLSGTGTDTNAMERDSDIDGGSRHPSHPAICVSGNPIGHYDGFDSDPLDPTVC